MLLVLAQASCANGLSTLMAMTSAPANELRPLETSHSSAVQTLVNASGKNSSTVFFLPKLSLSFTSTTPDAVLDLREKSGALVPTVIGIIVVCSWFWLFNERTQILEI